MPMNFCEQVTGNIYTELTLKNRGMPTDKIDIMRRSGFYPVEYEYIEYDRLTQRQVPIKPMQFDADTQVYRQHFEALPLNAEDLERNIEALRSLAISHIDEQTSLSILSGFDTFVNDTVLHFSYDERDQANFSSKQLQILTGKLLDKKISWKAYTIITDEDGNPLSDVKGDLVQLQLTPEEFTAICNEGASNASLKLSLGEQKKQDIMTAESIEELRILLEDFGISETQLLMESSTWQSIKDEKTS